MIDSTYPEKLILVALCILKKNCTCTKRKGTMSEKTAEELHNLLIKALQALHDAPPLR